MRLSVDLNADAGESFGRYRIGHDDELFPLLTSVSVACGYHASDPKNMRRAVRLAKQHGLKVGAHISYPDLVGFGRRKMDLTQDEVRDITVHQIGALSGFCLAEGVKMDHVKAHGQLYLTAVWHKPTADGIAEGVASVSKDLALFFYGDVTRAACKEVGVRMVNETYVDLDFYADGSLVLEPEKQPKDPAVIADIAVIAVKEGRRKTVDDTWIDLPAETLCIHGDAPNAVEIAVAVRKRLIDEGVAITPY